MKRRDFLKTASAAALIPVIPAGAAAISPVVKEPVFTLDKTGVLKLELVSQKEYSSIYRNKDTIYLVAG